VIPRHQTILLGVLVLASLVMGVALWQLRDRAHQRLVAGEDSAPTKAPEVAPAEQATLMVANDDDNSLLGQVHSLPLPSDPGSRARAILGRLLDIYAAANAAHPVPGGATSVAQVFLLPVLESDSGKAVAGTSAPGGSGPSNSGGGNSGAARDSGPELAVVNLTSSFVSTHPSGLETETLTVLSICGTLHANLPRVTQVRFLVDGQSRATLAGHADLTRTYLTSDAAPPELTHP
jgi:hypothetical protein